MATEERLVKKIKAVYTEVTKKLIDPTFKFPEGGKVDRQITQFIADFSTLCGGTINPLRVVDYCVFQIHKNRNAQFLRKLAPNAFGKTALEKYKSMASKNKKYVEDQWLSEAGLTRASLGLMISPQREHPQAKFIFMPSEEPAKRRCLNTEVGPLICATSTLMWSPFSAACVECNYAADCMKETELKYPEIYRLRLEEYGKRE